ncbi:MAG TPA: acetylornithine deacetylase [Pyrinomonadaceae bacterium]|nr:acetylornithine deacetylase [Pyrinomonadaceae bacterium]
MQRRIQSAVKAGALQIMTVQQTLADLVAIDSVSARSNAEIISYLEKRCEKLGLATQRFSHIDENAVEKINLVAVTANRSKAPSFPTSRESAGALQIELALVGHTDTVPYDPNWEEALTLTERDAKLFGRGACDTKAFIAAALTAVESIDLTNLTRPLALVFTCDEEIGCLGAKRLADAKPFTARYAIVGEPTSLQPMRAGKGYSLAQITVRGREAHSAYPQLGASAIFRAARLIEKIESIAVSLKQDQHADFDPPFTTLNVGVINGGTAKNIVPGECRFTLEWRTIPGQESQHVLNCVKQAAEALQQEESDFICEIDTARADDSFETSADSAVVHFLEDAAGQSSGTVAFGTEAPSMIALGAEAVVFGPGDIRVAHRTGEFVPMDELNECASILKSAIERFCMYPR